MVACLRTFFVAVILSAYLFIFGPAALLVAWLVGSTRMVFTLAVLAARFGLWATGVRISVHGLDHLDDGRNYLFMPNHTSNVDPPVVVAALGRNVSMMGKESLFRKQKINGAQRVEILNCLQQKFETFLVRKKSF